MNKHKTRYNPSGYFEETPADIINIIENKISISREETQKNILYKYDNGEVDLLYNGEKRKGIIMGGSSNGNLIISLLKDEQNY